MLFLKDTSMNEASLFLAVFSVVATPALAFEIEEIGTLEADFAGEAIAQPTVRARDGDEVSSTAFLHISGAGFSSLNLAGFSHDNARLDIGVEFHSDTPDAGMPPYGVEISYAPTGTAQRWVSDEASGAVSVSFTTLSFEGDEGQVTGTFSATLCYTESYEEDPDMNNCRPIEGSFDTPIAIER